MIALLQRVTAARVEIEGQPQAAILRGILALVCAERGDSQREAAALAEKTVDFRMFQDASERMNLNLIRGARAPLGCAPVHAGGRYRPWPQAELH